MYKLPSEINLPQSVIDEMWDSLSRNYGFGKYFSKCLLYSVLSLLMPDLSLRDAYRCVSMLTDYFYEIKEG